MKAFVYEKYGPPETLRMAEVDTPAPGAGEVLVKVLAVSVNAADWHVLRGKPLFYRATLGLLRPKHKILGGDIAGQGEAVGGGVTQFQPGDQVYANLLEHGYGGLRRIRVGAGGRHGVEAGQPVVRGGGCRADGGDNRPPGPWPPRRPPARPEGPDQRRDRRCGQLRGPARQGLRGRGDRRDQHPQHRPGPFPRRRPPRRLHHHRRRRMAGGATTASWTRSGTDRCPISEVRLPPAARPPSPGSPAWPS